MGKRSRWIKRLPPLPEALEKAKRSWDLFVRVQCGFVICWVFLFYIAGLVCATVDLVNYDLTPSSLLIIMIVVAVFSQIICLVCLKHPQPGYWSADASREALLVVKYSRSGPMHQELLSDITPYLMPFKEREIIVAADRRFKKDLLVIFSKLPWISMVPGNSRRFLMGRFLRTTYVSCDGSNRTQDYVSYPLIWRDGYYPEITPVCYCIKVFGFVWSPALHVYAPDYIKKAVETVALIRFSGWSPGIHLLPNEILFEIFQYL